MPSDAPDPDAIAAEFTATDAYDSALVIASGADATDIGAQITEPAGDPATASLWLVATAIWHVSRTAQESGGSATPSDVAVDAVRMLEQATGEGPDDS